MVKINPLYKEEQLRALKELYDLRENRLRGVIILLNNSYAREMSNNIMNIQDKVTELYNLLTPLAQYIESDIKDSK